MHRCMKTIRGEMNKMTPILLTGVLALALSTVSFNANAEVVNIGISTVGLYELPTEISKRKWEDIKVRLD